MYPENAFTVNMKNGVVFLSESSLQCGVGFCQIHAADDTVRHAAVGFERLLNQFGRFVVSGIYPHVETKSAQLTEQRTGIFADRPFIQKVPGKGQVVERDGGVRAEQHFIQVERNTHAVFQFLHSVENIFFMGRIDNHDREFFDPLALGGQPAVMPVENHIPAG